MVGKSPVKNKIQPFVLDYSARKQNAIFAVIYFEESFMCHSYYHSNYFPMDIVEI